MRIYTAEMSNAGRGLTGSNGAISDKVIRERLSKEALNGRNKEGARPDSSTGRPRDLNKSSHFLIGFWELWPTERCVPSLRGSPYLALIHWKCQVVLDRWIYFEDKMIYSCFSTE